MLDVGGRQQSAHIPGDQFQPAIEMLDDGRAGIDPIAAIDIGQAVDFADRRPVDVAADDAIETAFAGMADRRMFEVENEVQRCLDLALGVAGQRPVASDAELAAQPGEQAVEVHQQGVGLVAKHRHPAMMTRHLVEQVTVNEQ